MHFYEFMRTFLKNCCFYNHETTSGLYVITKNNLLLEDNKLDFYFQNPSVKLFDTLVSLSHTHTLTHTSKMTYVQVRKRLFILHQVRNVLKIHGSGSTKCLRANVRQYVGAAHFRKRLRGPLT